MFFRDAIVHWQLSQDGGNMPMLRDGMAPDTVRAIFGVFHPSILIAP
jgi:hypothetical protein